MITHEDAGGVHGTGASSRTPSDETSELANDGGLPSSPSKSEMAISIRAGAADYMALPIESRSLSWAQRMRNMRHSPCVMAPLTVLLFAIIGILALVGLVFRMPIFLLGLLSARFTTRANWFVEFIYPASIARTVHIYLMQWGLHSRVGRGSGVKGRKGKLIPPQHSRSAEQRTEVVKGRVYVHPIPQLLDNVGYLIVCCPPQGIIAPILSLLVDCGDAVSALAQIELIRDIHYSKLSSKPKIEIHAILSTHKHHDHTAGNKKLLNDSKTSRTLKRVYGGAIEKVPYCNSPLRNGDLIVLPKVDGNDMSDVVEIECIAVPSHTRGSIVYSLRNRSTMQRGMALGTPSRGDIVTHLFTGDAMFSGGGGVAFEADLMFPKDKDLSKKNRNSQVKVTGGRLSIERCFAEVLYRSISDNTVFPDHCSRVLMFPGHEYTADLLLRQFDQSNENFGNWSKLPPGVFFETASQYLVSSHRRSLPKNGRLLTVPTSIARELKINPHFRSLRKRGEHLVTGICVWYQYLSKTQAEGITHVGNLIVQETASVDSSGILESAAVVEPSLPKTPSTPMSWTLDHTTINRPVFKTIYASDLDAVVSDLKTGTIGASEAAQRLQNMHKKLEEPTVTRRPIPGTLPSEKNLYLAAVSLAVLGAPPCGITVRDSLAMNLPSPLDSSDEILISKERLISVLAALGMLDSQVSLGNMGQECSIVDMIDSLWKEARMGPPEIGKKTKTDVEHGNGNSNDDRIELGLLKMTMFGAALNQPSKWKYCLPCCGKKGGSTFDGRSPASTMRVSGGELVKHDVRYCPMCHAVGCPSADGTECPKAKDVPRGTSVDVMNAQKKIVLQKGVNGHREVNGPNVRSEVELRVIS